MRAWFVRWGAGAALLLAVAGCKDQAAPVAAVKTYPMRATVVGTNPADGTVMLQHEAIPGLMEAMTMSYRLKDAGVLSELHPGDRITADLLAQQDAAGPVAMTVDHIVVVAQARPDNLPKVQYHVPAAGDAVPDFVLLNQSGKHIRVSQFRGKVLVLTFVYTRCGLSDFCPKMSRNFAEIDKALAADASLYAKTHLLSVSFDPAYDTPAVLRSYGGAYTGRYSNETFAHWDFAAPNAADLQKVEQFFDLGVTQGDKQTLNHSLSTLVIGKDGRVIAFYPTNDWTAEQIVAQVKAAEQE